jgi:ABC-type phosphate transport system auxiliary subunit
MDTIQKLDKLAEMYAQQDVIRLDKQKLIDSILTDEIKAKIAEIEAEFKPQAEGLSQNISALESEVKTDVVTLGESVKGNVLHAVYAKGRITWDTKGLEGVLINQPELAKFRKEGDPSVSIRRV